MTEQQAATAPADGQTASDPKATEAQAPSVEDLLKEFDQGEKPAQPEPTPASDLTKERFDQVLSYVEDSIQEKQAAKFEKDLASAVKTVVGDSELDPEYVEGVLQARGAKSGAFRNAWMQRDQEPDKWNGVLRAVGKELSARSKGQPDQAATDDLAAATAAVRSSATKPAQPFPNAKQINQMTDAEFAKFKKGLAAG